MCAHTYSHSHTFLHTQMHQEALPSLQTWHKAKKIHTVCLVVHTNKNINTHKHTGRSFDKLIFLCHFEGTGFNPLYITLLYGMVYCSIQFSVVVVVDPDLSVTFKGQYITYCSLYVDKYAKRNCTKFVFLDYIFLYT